MVTEVSEIAGFCGGEGAVNVKEPEAKTEDATMLKGRKLVNLLHGLVAAYGDDAGTDEFPELAEEWVSKKDAVAFAEARVKEATDKLKQQVEERKAKFERDLEELKSVRPKFPRSIWILEGRINAYQNVLKFLEEAKQP